MTDKSATLETADEQFVQEFEFDVPGIVDIGSFESSEEFALLLELATAVVERALREYGHSAERVDERITTIEAVGEKARGDADV